MREFYFSGIFSGSGEELAERIKSLSLSPETKKIYRDLLNASLELGGTVRWEHDHDAMAIPEARKMQSGEIVILVLDKYGISDEERELAFDICQYGYGEAHRLSGEKPDSYDVMMDVLQ